MALETYLKSQRNLALERLNLINRKQKDTETFAEFLAAIRETAEDA